MNNTLVYGNEPTYRRAGVAWACFIAVGLGLVWGVGAVFTGWRLAWLAPLVAAAVAWAWRDAVHQPSRGTALWAAALVLGAAAVAWGTTTFAGPRYVSERELRQDPGLVLNAVRDWMYERGEIVDPFAEPVEPEEPAETEGLATAELQADAPPPPPPLRPEAQARQRLATLTDAQTRDIVARYLGQPGGTAARQKAAQQNWGWTDFVWVLLGAGIAFWFGSPRGNDDDDFDEDDED